MKSFSLLAIVASLISSQAFAAAGTYNGKNPQSGMPCSVTIGSDGQTFTLTDRGNLINAQFLKLLRGGPGVSVYDIDPSINTIIAKGSMLIMNPLTSDESQAMFSTTDTLFACLATLQK